MTTIYDVAKVAGVSSMTVSRALNTPDKVKPETRARIREIANELGYRKNHAASALQKNATGIIKIQMSAGLRGNHLYFSQLFAGITEVLSTHNLAMLLSSELNSDAACDGVILMGLTKAQQQSLIRSSTPKVLFGHGPETIDWLDFDNEQGTYVATRHLIEQGHTRIGLMDFPSTEPFIVERRAGYSRAMREAGLEHQHDALHTAVNNSVEAGFCCGRSFVKQRAQTAVVCCSDHVAVGLAQAAYEDNIRVPDDLSIIGFDGVGQERMGKPILTTIRQPVFDIGCQLAKRLIHLIERPLDALDASNWIAPELVLNESTAPPPRYFAVG